MESSTTTTVSENPGRRRQQQWQMFPTTKRRRRKTISFLRRRMENSSIRRQQLICTATGIIIIVPALLAMIASSMTGIMTTKTMTSTSLISVVGAFAPPYHGASRTTTTTTKSYNNNNNSNKQAFVGSLQATRAPSESISARNSSNSGGEDYGGGDSVPKQRKQKRTTTSSSGGTSSQLGVEVWDGVFSPDVCQELHELAIDHSERTTGEEEEEDDDDDEDDDSLDGSSIFIHRGRNNRCGTDKPLTPIEQALDSFLTAYHDRERNSDGDDDDDSNHHRSENTNNNNDVVVEYWCRQEHLNLEAHADVDEVWFERSCKKMMDSNQTKSFFRYPAIGHVLYLTKPTMGLGPTCVFPPKTSGNTNTNNNENDTDNDSGIRNEIDSVVTIPAVPGRVLRFPGNALHAVPKPADVWFSHEDGMGDSNDVDAEWDDDDDDDDDDEDEDEDYDDDDEERSVILFNTWEASSDDGTSSSDDGSIGPIGVPFDPMFHIDSDIGIVDMMMSSVDMDGVEVDETFVKGMVEYAKQQKNQKLQNWRENYCDVVENDNDTEQQHEKNAAEAAASTNNQEQPPTVLYSKVHCQPRDSWKMARIERLSPSHPDEGAATSGGDEGTIRVPLMGDKLRRRYPKKAVRWTLPSSFKKGVKESEKPCQFPLSE